MAQEASDLPAINCNARGYCKKSRSFVYKAAQKLGIVAPLLWNIFKIVYSMPRPKVILKGPRQLGG
jgi:hypothetical protein